jgi:hypothetical protein
MYSKELFQELISDLPVVRPVADSKALRIMPSILFVITSSWNLALVAE